MGRNAHPGLPEQLRLFQSFRRQMFEYYLYRGEGLWTHKTDTVMRLFHFSDDPSITEFVPRPVRVSRPRPLGQEWLNGPLVWGIDEDHAFLYCFPRECPRIVMWPTAETTDEDRAEYFPDSEIRAIAHIEASWAERHRTGFIYRYTLSRDGFRSIGDIGTWVCPSPVAPEVVEKLVDLPAALTEARVALHFHDRLQPFGHLRDRSFHVSSIRMRNAKG